VERQLVEEVLGDQVGEVAAGDRRSLGVELDLEVARSSS
jgi:hypothetical protein